MNEINVLLSNLKIEKEQPLVIATSGGVDSMVLLDYLYTNKYNIIAVHFNHQTRVSNKDDETLITNYCNARNIKHHIISLTINKKGNFQATARNLRYYHLKAIARKYKTKFILTAHHLDDLAETVLIKITRGSNLYGYAGIHNVYNESGYTFVRPLLSYSKKDIITYAKDNDIKYLDDITNFETNYLRNRYRHTIIPILKQENPQFLNKVYSYHQQLAKSANFIRTYSKKFITKGIIKVDELLKEDIVVVETTIAMLLEKNKIEFSYEIINKLITILKNDKPNITYNLSNNKVFVKAYNDVYISKKITIDEINEPLDYGINILPNMKIITLLKDASLDNKEIIKICYNKLKFPLIARHREDGDILSFKYGSKKLKNLLIDIKMPIHLRNELLIITDSDNTILWIPNVYINETLGSKEKIFLKIGDHINDK